MKEMYMTKWFPSMACSVCGPIAYSSKQLTIKTIVNGNATLTTLSLINEYFMKYEIALINMSLSRTLLACVHARFNETLI